MKVVANVKFPEFREEDRRDMQQFIQEFERVASHAAGGGQLMDQEWINMMVNSCGRATSAGRVLRVRQRSRRYKDSEALGDHAACRNQLLEELERLQRSDEKV